MAVLYTESAIIAETERQEMIFAPNSLTHTHTSARRSLRSERSDT